MEFGLVGSLSLILSADLQSQSVLVADVDLLPVAAATQRMTTRTRNTQTNITLFINYYLCISSNCPEMFESWFNYASVEINLLLSF